MLRNLVLLSLLKSYGAFCKRKGISVGAILKLQYKELPYILPKIPIYMHSSYSVRN